MEERESSSSDDRARSAIVGFVGRGAITARFELEALSQESPLFCPRRPLLDCSDSFELGVEEVSSLQRASWAAATIRR